MTAPIIDVRGLTFAYPDGTQALSDVELHVHQGERVALLGPNGAGKTSLVLHLNGIHRATQGTVEISGLPIVDANLTDIRRRVGLVFQDPDDQLFMPTVRRDAALNAVDIADLGDRPPHHLSLGQRRRAAIAGVLAMDPEILVLDEPTSNLDPATRREVASLVVRLGITLLVVTHDLPFALEVCERAVVMDRGRVVADGPTRSLLADAELMRRHRLELPFGMVLEG